MSASPISSPIASVEGACVRLRQRIPESSISRPSNQPTRGRLIEETKEAFRRHRPGGRKVSDAHLLEVWAMTTNILQQCDLCVNFNAFDFFSLPTENEPFKTEPVSAALNYGKQLHGPRPRYGMSYFVLGEEWKKTAQYCIRDASLELRNLAVGTPLGYDTLGAAYALAARHNERLRRALDEVFFHYGTLADDCTEAADTLLIEVRLCAPGLFTGGIKEIHLSPLSPRRGTNTPLEAPLTGELWDDIKRNATDFAERHGGKLIVMHE